MAVEKMNDIPKLISDVRTSYKRIKCLKDYGYLIEPQEVVSKLHNISSILHLCEEIEPLVLKTLGSMYHLTSF